jgi:hypothetical protein
MFEIVLDTLFDTANWKTERHYVIRRRVFFSLVAVALLVVMFYVSGKFWWTGNGYCFGDGFECMKPQQQMGSEG